MVFSGTISRVRWPNQQCLSWHWRAAVSQPRQRPIPPAWLNLLKAKANYTKTSLSSHHGPCCYLGHFKIHNPLEHRGSYPIQSNPIQSTFIPDNKVHNTYYIYSNKSKEKWRTMYNRERQKRIKPVTRVIHPLTVWNMYRVVSVTVVPVKLQTTDMRATL